MTYGRKVEGDWMWLGGREGGEGKGVGGWVRYVRTQRVSLGRNLRRYPEPEASRLGRG